MKIVGLTGGIGSGKTTIAKFFEKLGIPVYFSDDEAKMIMTTSSIVKNKLIEEFGKESYINKELNRTYIANIVFNNREKLIKLNSIVHPEVKNHFKKWTELQNAPYIIQEHPLLFENKNQSDFDVIILVTAPLEIRLSRAAERDDSTIENVRSRINNQMDDQFKVENSNFIIQNVDLAQSELQVSLIHDEILNLNL